MSKSELENQLKLTRAEMENAAKDLDFPLAAKFRDEMLAIQEKIENYSSTKG
jgi:excinuclease ABC subunit B